MLIEVVLQQDKDVDYRVMRTFLEFYEVLVGFVNYKLFHSLGLKYPPKLDEIKDVRAGALLRETEAHESLVRLAANSWNPL